MLAAGVLPLATAYSISEALGFEKGVSRSFREAPIFHRRLYLPGGNRSAPSQ